MWSFLFYFVLLACTLAQERESWLVQTAQGPVRGYKNPDADVFEFYGIPYATAPTGTRRFKAPLPPPTWSTPLEAEEKLILCPQVSFGLLPPNATLKEDCLVANIHIPAKLANKLPVVVYVHGGGYAQGYGNAMHPNKLVNSQKVIAITFNYRLGAHGFLCLGTKDVPGNAGMKDQVELLRWVKKNIGSFGGDPDDVTIAGYSAGASAVDLLGISKMAKGLFKRVIPDSGSNLAALSIQSDPIQVAKEYAKLLNFVNVDDLNALENFYKSTSVFILNSADVLYRPDSTSLMSPCIESDTGEESFLEDSPFNILKNGDYENLPTLYGFTNMEGLLRIELFDTWKDQMNEKFSDFLPPDLKFKDEEEREQVANRIKTFYFGDNLVDQNTILAYVDYFTDVIFSYPAQRSIKLQVQVGNHQIYLYYFSYTHENTPFVPYTNVKGAEHTAQTQAVFGIGSDDDDIFDMTREMWLNFITSGKPILENSELPDWPAVGVDWSPYMSINNTIELKNETLLMERMLFWENIYDNYYRVPVPPTVSVDNSALSVHIFQSLPIFIYFTIFY